MVFGVNGLHFSQLLISDSGTSILMSFRLISAIVLILAATVFCGLVQGRWTYRWGMPSQSVASGAMLEKIPVVIGDWRMKSDNDVSQEVLDTLQCTGHVFRTYVNDKTQEQIQVAILVGPAGPISVHTPEICYNGQNFEASTEREEIPIGPESLKAGASAGELTEGVHAGDSFWGLVFRTADVHAAPMSVYYAWSDGETWRATDQPRHSFAGIPNLFKVQVAGLMSGAAVLGTSSDPCYCFLNDFLKVAWPLPDEALP